MSPNIAWPLTLRTSPSDKTFFDILYQVAFGKRKTAKYFHSMFSWRSRGGIWQKIANVVKNFLTLISNAPGFKLFSLNQVIDEVNC